LVEAVDTVLPSSARKALVLVLHGIDARTLPAARHRGSIQGPEHDRTAIRRNTVATARRFGALVHLHLRARPAFQEGGQKKTSATSGSCNGGQMWFPANDETQTPSDRIVQLHADCITGVRRFCRGDGRDAMVRRAGARWCLRRADDFRRAAFWGTGTIVASDCNRVPSIHSAELCVAIWSTARPHPGRWRARTILRLSCGAKAYGGPWMSGGRSFEAEFRRRFPIPRNTSSSYAATEANFRCTIARASRVRSAASQPFLTATAFRLALWSSSICRKKPAERSVEQRAGRALVHPLQPG